MRCMLTLFRWKYFLMLGDLAFSQNHLGNGWESYKWIAGLNIECRLCYFLDVSTSDKD